METKATEASARTTLVAFNVQYKGDNEKMLEAIRKGERPSEEAFKKAEEILGDGKKSAKAKGISVYTILDEAMPHKWVSDEHAPLVIYCRGTEAVKKAMFYDEGDGVPALIKKGLVAIDGDCENDYYKGEEGFVPMTNVVKMASDLCGAKRNIVLLDTVLGWDALKIIDFEKSKKSADCKCKVVVVLNGGITSARAEWMESYRTKGISISEKWESGEAWSEEYEDRNRYLATKLIAEDIFIPLITKEGRDKVLKYVSDLAFGTQIMWVVPIGMSELLNWGDKYVNNDVLTRQELLEYSSIKPYFHKAQLSTKTTDTTSSSVGTITSSPTKLIHDGSYISVPDRKLEIGGKTIELTALNEVLKENKIDINEVMTEHVAK